MKNILIANSGTPELRITTSNHGHKTCYYFRQVYSMGQAHRFAGMELDDLVWVAYPYLPEVQIYLETRVRGLRAASGEES